MSAKCPCCNRALPKPKKQSVECIKLESGRYLWRYPNGREVTATFAYDAKAEGRIKAEVSARIKRRLRAPQENNLASTIYGIW